MKVATALTATDHHSNELVCLRQVFCPQGSVKLWTDLVRDQRQTNAGDCTTSLHIVPEEEKTCTIEAFR